MHPPRRPGPESLSKSRRPDDWAEDGRGQGADRSCGASSLGQVPRGAAGARDTMIVLAVITVLLAALIALAVIKILEP